MWEVSSPKLFSPDEVAAKLKELVDRGVAARVHIDIGGGRIWRVAVAECPPLDTEKPRVENLSVGEEPSTP